MPAASLTRTMDVPADALWRLLEDFGDTSWMPGGTEVVLEGEGVGMTRVVGGQIREQLQSLDAAARTLTYRIHDEGCPFPAKGYVATVTVAEDGGETRLRWSCEAEPLEGTTPDQLKATIEGMYGVMAGWIEDRVKAIG
jgi:carbon monoxide dehydrogenase subunit G